MSIIYKQTKQYIIKHIEKKRIPFILIYMIIFKPHQSCSIIKEFLPPNPIIVEAGAFTGKDTLRMAHTWPAGIIHTFEPVAELYTQLCTNTAHMTHVHTYPFALDNKSGKALFYISEKPEKPGRPSQANSLRAPKERLHHSPLTFNKTINIPTITLKDWADQYCINTIDMLWLDTQGHEQSIIEGAVTLLPTVQVIFTEVSFIEAYTGQLTFNNFTQWLKPLGFQLIGKDFSTTTDWFFGNALYVRT